MMSERRAELERLRPASAEARRGAAWKPRVDDGPPAEQFLGDTLCEQANFGGLGRMDARFVGG